MESQHSSKQAIKAGGLFSPKQTDEKKIAKENKD